MGSKIFSFPPIEIFMICNCPVTPKTTMKERMAVLAAIPKSASAICGMMVRSRPIIPPTKAFTITNKVKLLPVFLQA